MIYKCIYQSCNQYVNMIDKQVLLIMHVFNRRCVIWVLFPTQPLTLGELAREANVHEAKLSKILGLYIIGQNRIL